MKLISLNWKPADSAYGRGQQAYIEFGQALANLVAEGATQEQIAARYDMSTAAVSQVISVGADKRFSNTKSLPKSTHALYLLTTLDDKGFAELAKPETTQARILEYKRRLAPPPEPTVEAPRKPIVPPRVNPPAPVQGRVVSPEELAQARREAETLTAPKESYSKDLSWAFATFGIQGTPMISMESLDAIYRVLSAKRHPDKPGGSTIAMSDLNTARTMIVERNIWVR